MTASWGWSFKDTVLAAHDWHARQLIIMIWSRAT